MFPSKKLYRLLATLGLFCIVHPSYATCIYTIDGSPWASGNNGKITITNRSSAAITKFNLSWSYSRSTLDHGWNATFPAPGAKNISVTEPKGWSINIAPGASYSLGLSVNKTGDAEVPVVSGDVCGAVAASSMAKSSLAPSSVAPSSMPKSSVAPSSRALSSAASSSPPASDWVACANEYEMCDFSGTKKVRYGAGTTWSEGVYTNQVACGNGVFGDPIQYTAKSCQVADVAWTNCAAEGGYCNFSGKKIVRFGATTLWSERAPTNQVFCDRSVFGDPAAGIFKACQTTDAISENFPQDLPSSSAAKSSALASSVRSSVVAISSRASSSNSGQFKESVLWGPDGSRWDPAGNLPDFSYAGYHSTDIDLPNINVISSMVSTGAKPDDTTGDSDELQTLINNQRSLPMNQRGAIFIPKGRWVLEKPVLLNVSGVVLRGEVDSAGNPLTEFYIDPRQAKSTAAGPYFIQMSGGLSMSNIGKVSANVNQGEKSFTISYSGGTTLKTNDFIRLTQTDPSDQSLSKYLHGSNVPASAETAALGSLNKTYFTWYAKVVSVQGNRVTLDRPLPIRVATNWSPNISKFDVANSAAEMGVENISMRFNNRINYEHLEYYGFNGISMSGVTNSWIKNVSMIDSDMGILVTGKSCYNTIRGIKFKDDLRKETIPARVGDLLDQSKWVYKLQQSGTSHHPLYATNAHFNLFENFYFQYINWHELSVEVAASYNVFRNGSGVAVAFDNHRHIPFSNLWTNINVGLPERLYWNSGQGQRGPNAGFRNTFWNISYAGGLLGTAPGGESGFRNLNLVGIVGARAGDASQHVEITGAGEKVAQPDLFQAQLNRRKSN